MYKLKVDRYSNSPMYFRICRDSNNKISRLVKKFDGKRAEYASEFLNVVEEVKRNIAFSTIFAALCLEAFIFDYAAHHLTTTFAKKYLDKSNLIEKWVIVPRFVLGKDFPRESQAFQNIRDLKKQRDKIVHSKSVPAPTQEQTLNFIKQNKISKETEWTIRIRPVNRSEQIMEVFTELKKIEEETGNIQGWWGIEKTNKKYE